MAVGIISLLVQTDIFFYLFKTDIRLDHRNSSVKIILFAVAADRGSS